VGSFFKCVRRRVQQRPPGGHTPVPQFPPQLTGRPLLACPHLCRRGLAVSITSLGKEKPPTLNPDVVTPEGAEAVDPRADSAMTTASAATTASDGVDPRIESALKRLSGTYRVDYQVGVASRVLLGLGRAANVL
jgi:hypothetical protein